MFTGDYSTEYLKIHINMLELMVHASPHPYGIDAWRTQFFARCNEQKSRPQHCSFSRSSRSESLLRDFMYWSIWEVLGQIPEFCQHGSCPHSGLNTLFHQFMSDIANYPEMRHICHISISSGIEYIGSCSVAGTTISSNCFWAHNSNTYCLGSYWS